MPHRPRRNKRKPFVEPGQLSEAQICFFMFGWTWDFMDHPSFPFQSQKQRQTLWHKHRDELIRKCHEPRDLSDWCRPDANVLRPFEWWCTEAQEEKLIFNDAVRYPNNPNIFNKWPLWETDYEYLTRLGLLTDQDKEYALTEEFQQAENYSLAYRKFDLEVEAARAMAKEKVKGVIE